MVSCKKYLHVSCDDAHNHHVKHTSLSFLRGIWAPRCQEWISGGRNLWLKNKQTKPKKKKPNQWTPPLNTHSPPWTCPVLIACVAPTVQLVPVSFLPIGEQSISSSMSLMLFSCEYLLWGLFPERLCLGTLPPQITDLGQYEKLERRCPMNKNLPLNDLLFPLSLPLVPCHCGHREMNKVLYFFSGVSLLKKPRLHKPRILWYLFN